MTFVIDASVVLAWLVPDEQTPAADAVRDAAAHLGVTLLV